MWLVSHGAVIHRIGSISVIPCMKAHRKVLHSRSPRCQSDALPDS